MSAVNGPYRKKIRRIKLCWMPLVTACTPGSREPRPRLVKSNDIGKASGDNPATIAKGASRFVYRKTAGRPAVHGGIPGSGIDRIFLRASGEAAIDGRE